MSRLRLEMKLDPEEEKLMLPSSSEDEDEEEPSGSEVSDEEEPEIRDPFEKEESDSDSDGAPEALSFKDAFEDNMAQKKQVTQVIKTHLEERKKKRKELHDEFMLSKEEKRQKIESKMLPEEFLDDLEKESFPLKDKTLVEESDSKETSESSEDEELPVNTEHQKLSEEVVAVHGPTVFKCKVIKEGTKQPKQIPEKILNFKEQLLYGGRIRRETSAKAAKLKVEKQRARR